jgi:hypothetical protein
MFKKFAVASALVIFMAGTAFASQCPKLMQEVDAALPTATLSDEDKAKVTELRAKGEAEHAAGNHAESEAALNEAKTLLGI